MRERTDPLHIPTKKYIGGQTCPLVDSNTYRQTMIRAKEGGWRGRDPLCLKERELIVDERMASHWQQALGHPLCHRVEMRPRPSSKKDHLKLHHTPL